MRKFVVKAILVIALAVTALGIAEANWFGIGEPIPCRRAYMPMLPRVICVDNYFEP